MIRELLLANHGRVGVTVKVNHNGVIKTLDNAIVSYTKKVIYNKYVYEMSREADPIPFSEVKEVIVE